MKGIVNKKRLVFLSIIVFITFFFSVTSKAQTNKKYTIDDCRNLYNQKTEESWKKAYELICSELASSGNAEAQYYTGMIIKNSPKIPDYKATAYSFFYVANENGEKRAAKEIKEIGNIMDKKDFATSYIILANIVDPDLKKSNMVKKSDKKSFEFTLKASELGYFQDGLCASYAIGAFGTFKFPKDYVQAYKWCYLSNFDPKIRNNKESQKVFVKLKSLMTKEQILQGEKLAKDWIKNNPTLIKDLKN